MSPPSIDFTFDNDKINRLNRVKGELANVTNEVTSVGNCDVCLTPNIVNNATCSHVTTPQNFIQLSYDPADFTFSASETKQFTHTGSTSNGGTTWNCTGRQTVQTFAPNPTRMTGGERLINTSSCQWGMRIDDYYLDAKFRPMYVDAASYDGGVCSSTSDYGTGCLALPDVSGSQTLETATGPSELVDTYLLLYPPGGYHTNTLSNSTYNLPAGSHPTWTEINLNSSVYSSTNGIYAFWKLVVSSTQITLYLNTYAQYLAYYEVKYTSGGHAAQDVYVIRDPAASALGVGTDYAFEPWHFNSRNMFSTSNTAAWSTTAPATHLGVARTADSNAIIAGKGTSSQIVSTIKPGGLSSLTLGVTHNIQWTKSITAPITGTHTLTAGSHPGDIVTNMPTTIDVTF